jgi:WD40 repeat protein
MTRYLFVAFLLVWTVTPVRAQMTIVNMLEPSQGGPVYSSWSPDGRYVALQSLERSIRIWDMPSKSEYLPIPGYNWAAYFSSDGEKLLTIGNMLRIFSTKERSVLRSFPVMAGSAVANKRFDTVYFSLSKPDSFFYAWDTVTDSVRKRQLPINCHVNSVSPDGKRVLLVHPATISEVLVYDLELEKIVVRFKTPEYASVRVDPKWENVLATRSSSTTLINLITGSIRATYQWDKLPADLAPCGYSERHAGTIHDTIHVHRYADKEILGSVTGENIWPSSLSPDCQWVVYYSSYDQMPIRMYSLVDSSTLLSSFGAPQRDFMFSRAISVNVLEIDATDLSYLCKYTGFTGEPGEYWKAERIGSYLDIDSLSPSFIPPPENGDYQLIVGKKVRNRRANRDLFYLEPEYRTIKMMLAPRGNALVGTISDSTYVWSLPDTTPVVFYTPGETVAAMHYASPNFTTIDQAHDKIVVRDLKTGSVVSFFDGYYAKPNCVAVARSESTMLVGYANGAIVKVATGIKATVANGRDNMVAAVRNATIVDRVLYFARLSNDPIVSVSIVDMLGRIVVVNSLRYSDFIDLSKLAPGHYTAIICHEDHSTSHHRLVKR